MRSTPDILRQTFLLFVVCASLAAVALDLSIRIQSWNPVNLNNDPVTNWERRIEPLKADLPKNGEIGYLSDWDLPGWTGGQSDMDNEYRLTQYTLAPRLLVRGSGYAQIVVNLTNPEDVKRIEEKYNLRKTHDYGLGIYLFEGHGQ